MEVQRYQTSGLKSQMKASTMTQAKEKQFACQTCGNTYRHEQHLITHQKVYCKSKGKKPDGTRKSCEEEVFSSNIVEEIVPESDLRQDIVQMPVHKDKETIEVTMKQPGHHRNSDKPVTDPNSHEESEQNFISVLLKDAFDTVRNVLRDQNLDSDLMREALAVVEKYLQNFQKVCWKCTTCSFTCQQAWCDHQKMHRDQEQTLMVRSDVNLSEEPVQHMNTKSFQSEIENEITGETSTLTLTEHLSNADEELLDIIKHEVTDPEESTEGTNCSREKETSTTRATNQKLSGEQTKIASNMFVCKTCSKAFSKAWNLKTHERIHTGEKPYACPKCNKRFVQSSHLQAHEKRNSCQLTALRENEALPEIENHQNGKHTSESKTENNSSKMETLNNEGLIPKDSIGRDSVQHMDTKSFLSEIENEITEETSPLTLTNYLPNAELLDIIEHGMTGWEEFTKVTDCSRDKETSTTVETSQKLSCDQTKIESNMFTCKTCGKTFSKAWNLKIHERIHTGEKPYACPKCNKRFVQLSNFQAHEKRNSCQLTSLRENEALPEIENHQDGKHTGESKTENKSSKMETLNNEGLISKDSMARDSGQHMDTKSFQSEIDKEITGETSALTLTEYLSNADVELLDIIEDEMTGPEESTKVTDCSGDKENSTTIETSQKPSCDQTKIESNMFICKTCSKVFSRAWNLKTHERIHTGEKPYACPKCNKRFVQCNHLQAHEKRNSCQLTALRENGALPEIENHQKGKQSTGESKTENKSSKMETIKNEKLIPKDSIGDSVTLRFNSGGYQRSMQTMEQAWDNQKKLSDLQRWDHCGQAENDNKLGKIVTAETGPPRPSDSLTLSFTTDLTLEKMLAGQSTGNDLGKTENPETLININPTQEPPVKVNLELPKDLDPKYQTCLEIFNKEIDRKKKEEKITREKPFECQVCNKRFLNPSMLKRHNVVHSDAKDFKCEGCNKEFSYKHNLRTHVKNNESCRKITSIQIDKKSENDSELSETDAYTDYTDTTY